MGGEVNQTALGFGTMQTGSIDFFQVQASPQTITPIS
jgi:hypothetical protein